MKIWKITCCKMCPKIGSNYCIAEMRDYCYAKNKIVENLDTIPKWCPLEDYSENNNNRKNC